MRTTPRVRPSIEYSWLSDRRGEPYVVAGDIALGAYLRLTPEEHAFALLVDGTRTIAELESAGLVPAARARELMDLFEESGFFDGPAWTGAQAAPTVASLPGRAARAFVSSELSSGRFDRWFAFAYQHGGRWFFGRPAAVAAIILGLCGPLFLALEFERGRYPLFRAGDSYFLGIVLFFALETVTIVIHEHGHALAVKHAKRFAPRAGVMVYYGFPAAFVDTSDIWMAPRKLRLLTSFAGPWCDLVLGGIIATAAFVLPEGHAGMFLFAWGFVLVMNALLNLIPLLEFDGYYLFIDLVDKPMLRPRSLAFVRGPLWRRIWRRQAFEGDEAFLAVFGLLSVVFSVLMLGVAILFWTRRTWPAIHEVWGTEWLWAQVGLVAFGALILLGLALSAASWVERFGWTRLFSRGRQTPVEG